MIANSGTDLMDNGALAAGGPAPGAHRAVGRPLDRRPEQEGARHGRAGHRRVGPINGKPYLMNYVFSAYGLWYDARCSRRTAGPRRRPSTSSSFATRSRPPASPRSRTPGQERLLLRAYVILTSAAKIEGNQILMDIDNLVDGAWQRDAMKQSAAAWAEIGAKYMDKSFEGLMHTEVQLRRTRTRSRSTPAAPGWRTSRRPDPGRLQVRADAHPSVTAADKMPSRPSAPPPARPTSSPPRQEPQGRAWSTCADALQGGRQGFTEQTNSPSVTGAADGLELAPGIASSQRRARPPPARTSSPAASRTGTRSSRPSAHATNALVLRPHRRRVLRDGCRQGRRDQERLVRHQVEPRRC